MNDFFVLDANGSTSAELKAHARPIVTRSNQLTGAAITDADWHSLYDRGDARLLLALEDEVVPEGELARYLEHGVTEGVDRGYKCRIRRNWYVVPSTWVPTGFMLRQIHSYPKLALNLTAATSTDTVHRVRFHDDEAARAVVSAFYNPATFLTAELFGRSYGGGVLELEPSEAESLLLPPLDVAPPFAAIDAVLRAGDVPSLLTLGNTTLAAGVGLSVADLETLEAGWRRLRDRRHRRTRKAMSTDATRLTGAAGRP
jgi:hypothetical protein